MHDMIAIIERNGGPDTKCCVHDIWVRISDHSEKLLLKWVLSIGTCWRLSDKYIYFGKFWIYKNDSLVCIH